MPNKFFISDTHFSHANILNFTGFQDGKPVRTFASVEEMDATMISRWNSVVRPNDTVYHLGDVVINRKALPLVGQLNGRKILIKGNHDIYDIQEYLEYFADVRAYKVFPQEGFICSHIPLHPGELGHFKFNVHGHTHTNVVMENVYVPCSRGCCGEYEDRPDPRYVNVCVEKLDYTPIELTELQKRFL